MKYILPKNLFRDGLDLGNEPINLNSLDRTRKFIQDNFTKIKGINKSIGSYRLKHVVENNVKEMNIDVSNGDFIASMILEGYEYKRNGKKSPNANFNLSQKSVKPFLKFLLK